MLYLKKNTQNTFVTELTNISSLVAPNYLFEMISDRDSDYTKRFNVTDESNFKSRYNKFEITESGSTMENLSASTINITPGSYTLNVYEAVSPTLEVSATTGTIIYTGKAYVSGDNDEIDEIYR